MAEKREVLARLRRVLWASDPSRGFGTMLVKLWYAGAIGKRGWNALEPLWLLENLISVPFSLPLKKKKIIK